MSARIRVAVVDDHIMVSEMLALSISKESDLQLVDVAASMADAIDLVRRDRPDVVLMNYRLPDGDGFDVVRKILGEFPDTRIVMLSGNYNDVLREQSFEAGCIRFLGKDQSISDVLSAIRSAAHEELSFTPDEFMGDLDNWRKTSSS